MNFSTDTWIIIVLNALSVFAAYYFPIRKIPKEKNNEKRDSFVYLKKKTILWVVSILAIVLVGDLGWYLYKSIEPLLVFAGGGSVRNFLLESPEFKNEKNGEGIDIRKGRNSINIAMASGSAWRVLAEEYQFRNMKDPKLNKFTTICLSADTISGTFYSEYLEDLDGYIIAAVFLGNDTLYSYISNGVKDYWKIGDANTISSDVLGHNIQEIINTETIIVNRKPKKVRIFTTNKTSGTLESYKKCLSNYIHLEQMIDSGKVSIFYDNMAAKNIDTYKTENSSDNFRDFIILGSKYYTVKMVKDKCKPLKLLDKNSHSISKQMYLYFLAKEKDTNKYEIDKRVIKFLKKLEKHNKKIKSTQTTRWDEIMKTGIIFYDKSTYSRYPNIVQIN